MSKLKNELPVAVHNASGGCARLRCGGESISLNGVSTGQFVMEQGTRFRAFVNLRTSSGLLLILGYTSPVTIANCSMMCLDLVELSDDVPQNTTVYFALINPSTLQPSPGSTLDYLSLSYYE